MKTDSIQPRLILTALLATTALALLPSTGHAAARMHMIGACQVYETDESHSSTVAGTVLVRCPAAYTLRQVGTIGGSVISPTSSTTQLYSTSNWVKYEVDHLSGGFIVDVAAGMPPGFTPLLRDPGNNDAVLVSGMRASCPLAGASGSTSVTLPPTTAKRGKLAANVPLNFNPELVGPTASLVPMACSGTTEDEGCKEGDKDCEHDDGDCKEGDKDCEHHDGDCKEGDRDCEHDDGDCKEGDKECEHHENGDDDHHDGDCKEGDKDDCKDDVDIRDGKDDHEDSAAWEEDYKNSLER